LLADPNFNPTNNFNEAFSEACWNDRLDVVKALVADQRIDPAFDRSLALLEASRDGAISVLAFLLALPGMDPSAQNNSAVKWASEGGHVSAVQLLLADPRVDVAPELLFAADERTADVNNEELVISMYLAARPQLISYLCHGFVVCYWDDALRRVLDLWEARSVMTLLLSIKRTQTPRVAGRLSDVLREVLSKFTKFNVVHVVDY
jgi:hypothetical protein